MTAPDSVPTNPFAPGGANSYYGTSALATISGTAEDNVSYGRVEAVEFALKDLSKPNTFWVAGTWQVGEGWTSATVSPAQSVVWQFNFSAYTGMLTDGTSYSVYSRGYDKTEPYNRESSYTEAIFTWDSVPGVSTITYPVHNGDSIGSPIFEGKYYDQVLSKGKRVEVLLLAKTGDNAGLYWQGGDSSWGAAQPAAWPSTENHISRLNRLFGRDRHLDIKRAHLVCRQVSIIFLPGC